jgi:flagellar hook-associated protein 3 FlgL
VQNLAQQDRIDQYVQSANSLNSQFKTADSTLSTMVTSLNRAVSLRVEAGNGALSAQNQQSIAQEAQGVLDQLVQLANTSFNGSYLFAGTNTT